MYFQIAFRFSLSFLYTVIRRHDLTKKPETNTKTMKKTMTKTMAKTNTFTEHLQRSILETYDL